MNRFFVVAWAFAGRFPASGHAATLDCREAGTAVG